MAKKELKVPQTGISATPVKAVTEATPMQKMLHQEKKKEKERTTICVDPELYKEFKMRTIANDTTVTAVLEKAMKEYMGE